MSNIHGKTSDGQLVHKRTWDFHSPKSFFSKVNSKFGLKITLAVGTMWCAYIFTILAVFALPSAIHQGTYYVIVWLSSSFLQLVLLPIIIVGQNIQATASDVRATKTFEDTETILDRFSLETAGGLKDLKDHIDARLDELAKGK
jgi:hypothetical protein